MSLLLAVEGADLGGDGLAADGAARGLAAFVGFPVLSADVGVGVDGPVSGGKQGVSLQADDGGELAGALGAVLQAVDAVAVLVAVLVGDGAGGVAGLCGLAVVEVAGAMGGADEAIEVVPSGWTV